VVGVADHSGMGDLFGWRVTVGFNFPIEPARGVTTFGWEMWLDQFGVGEEVRLFVQVNPDTIHTAGGFTGGPTTALNGFGIVEAGRDFERHWGY